MYEWEAPLHLSSVIGASLSMPQQGRNRVVGQLGHPEKRQVISIRSLQKEFSQSGKKLDLSHIMTRVNLTEQDKLLSTLEIEMEPADLNKQTLVLS